MNMVPLVTGEPGTKTAASKKNRKDGFSAVHARLVEWWICLLVDQLVS
jgi:hypothetical protein